MAVLTFLAVMLAFAATSTRANEATVHEAEATAEAMDSAESGLDVNTVSSHQPFLVTFVSGTDCNDNANAVGVATVRSCQMPVDDLSLQLSCVKYDNGSVLPAQVVYNSTDCSGDVISVDNSFTPTTCQAQEGGFFSKAMCLQKSGLKDLVGDDVAVARSYFNMTCEQDKDSDDLFMIYPRNKCLNVGPNITLQVTCSSGQVTQTEYNDMMCSDVNRTETYNQDECVMSDEDQMYIECTSVGNAFDQSKESAAHAITSLVITALVAVFAALA